MADKTYDPEQGLPDINAAENKETGNVIGGLKASLSNDNNSEEAKAADREKLEALRNEGAKTFEEREAE